MTASWQRGAAGVLAIEVVAVAALVAVLSSTAEAGEHVTQRPAVSMPRPVAQSHERIKFGVPNLILTPPSLRPVFLARPAQSPCERTTATYHAAQEALAGGDIDSADDLAVLAGQLIDQCGWTRTDTALGGQ